MIRFRWYRPAPGACFFDAREREHYNAGRAAAAAGLPCTPLATQKRLAFAFSRGWATVMASTRTTRGRALPPLPADKPRKLCAWTLANDARIDRTQAQAAPVEHHDNTENAGPTRAHTTTTATHKGPTHMQTHTDDDAARKSEAARKAWATRRAQGWTHPATGNTPRASAAPAEPIKRASLAELAKGVSVAAIAPAPKPEARAKRAAEISAARPDGKPRKTRADIEAATPKRKVRKGKPAPKKAPAKKAAPKKAAVARSR